MNLGKREGFAGAIFALFIAIFLNYSSVERLFGADRVVNMDALPSVMFSLFWFMVVSMLLYLLYVLILNMFAERGRSIVLVLTIIAVTLVVNYLLAELYPHFRDAIVGVAEQRQGGRPPMNRAPHRGVNPVLLRHLTISLLNLLFVYIQRLLFRNQEIERRNEQLQLENVKSQHSALIQQVNPHFFFNSLGSLRYIIVRGDSDKAVEFLDNLTLIFRKTLKLSSNTQHSVHEEIALTLSYINIIEKRFEGKIFVNINIDDIYDAYILSPLSLLTLIENVVKHNKVSAKSPIYVNIYTTELDEMVVENNIVPKFETVESNGFGLINLNKQYQLLTGKEIEVTSLPSSFRVVLPLIKCEV